MNKFEVLNAIREIGVVPVIRINDLDNARNAVEAMILGGIKIFEVTMTVPNAISLIDELSKREGLVVGAGTVLDPETAGECIDAGAAFVVSPSTNIDTVAYCNERQTAVMPGALTPTEIVNAWEAGADIVKVFPAGSLGGPKYIRSLKGPLPHIKMMPTGGVSIDSVADYLLSGAEAVGVGSELVDVRAVEEGRLDELTGAAKAYLQAVEKARASLKAG